MHNTAPSPFVTWPVSHSLWVSNGSRLFYRQQTSRKQPRQKCWDAMHAWIVSSSASIAEIFLLGRFYFYRTSLYIPTGTYFVNIFFVNCNNCISRYNSSSMHRLWQCQLLRLHQLPQLPSPSCTGRPSWRFWSQWHTECVNVDVM